MELIVIAGIVSTVLFALSNVPMLRKAMRTRDMTSYSVGNLVMSNVANAVHSVYVFSLPAGPIWFLHTFYVVAAAIMLILYLSPVPGGGDGRPPTVRHHPGVGPRADLLPPVSKIARPDVSIPRARTSEGTPAADSVAT